MTQQVKDTVHRCGQTTSLHSLSACFDLRLKHIDGEDLFLLPLRRLQFFSCAQSPSFFQRFFFFPFLMDQDGALEENGR